MKKLLLLSFLFVSFWVSAQTESFITEKIQLNYLGLSQPTINFNNLPSNGPITRFEKDEDQDKEGRIKNQLVNAAAFFKGADPVMQATTNALNIAINQQVLVEGPDVLASNVSPPDVNGETGSAYYVQTINVLSGGSLVSIYNKSNGTLSSSFNTNTAFWTPLGFTSLGDPVILFDEVAQKWVLVEMRTTGNQILLAVSQTNNPAGAWYRYNFSTSAFPDFPKLSIWNNAILMTDNENGLAAAPIYAINKSAVYAGTTSTILRTTIPFVSGVGFQPITPVDWDGTTAPVGDPMVIRMYDNVWSNSGGADHVELRTIAINFSTNTITPSAAINVNTAAFNSFFCNSFNCVPQFGSTTLLDNQAEYINYRSQYRNFGTHESVVCAFGVNVDGTTNGRSGIRWMELRKIGAGAWSVYQEGTYAPADGLSRFVGSIALDAFNNIAIGYNVINSTNKYYSARVTGRLASDALGVMTFAENEMATGTHPYDGGGGRTGDYYSISVDPADGKTFWFTSHYAKTVSNTGSWGTKIIAFKLEPDCTIPTQVGTFTASTTPVCKSQNSVVYTVSAVSGATSYTWSYSGSGATITGTTNSVSINFSASATSGTLSVIANNACGSSITPRTLPITVNDIPTTPTITTNKPIICSGLGAILTATGCTGTVIWSNGATGSSITVTPIVNTVYNAVCGNTPCPTSSVSSNISITVITQNLTINSATPAPFQAKDNITTSGTIAISGSKTYKAGKSIVLSSSPSNTVSTNTGAVFEAKIEGCSY